MISKEKNLDMLREAIDNIDNLLITLLEKRFDAVELIGDEKKEQDLPVLDEKREKEILSKIDQSKYPENIKNIYNKIFDESKDIQK